MPAAMQPKELAAILQRISFTPEMLAHAVGVRTMTVWLWLAGERPINQRAAIVIDYAARAAMPGLGGETSPVIEIVKAAAAASEAAKEKRRAAKAAAQEQLAEQRAAAKAERRAVAIERVVATAAGGRLGPRNRRYLAAAAAAEARAKRQGGDTNREAGGDNARITVEAGGVPT